MDCNPDARVSWRRDIRFPYMDPVYVRDANYAEMILTPGQWLEIELERLKLDKAKLARKMGIRQATVSDWCNGKGAFNGDTSVAIRNRRSVERALNLPEGHLDQATAVTLHRQRCADALTEFLNSPLRPKDLTEIELTNLWDTAPPLTKEPTSDFYEAYTYLIRNKLKDSNYEQELSRKGAALERVEQKLEKAFQQVAMKSEGMKKKRTKDAHKRTKKKSPEIPED